MQNHAIMASAGTGKTFNLAMRYIRLIQEGAEPASIVALTFSNKAAGEILDKIITQLLELAEKPGALAQAAAQGFLREETTTADIRRILHGLLSSREQLQISTIDSFFMRILQAFPIECGIAGSISMIDEEDDRPRLQALIKLFANADDAKRRELLEHLKNISFGNDEKSLSRIMVDFLRDTYPIYLDNPDPDLWGNANKIWKEYDPGMILSAEELRRIRGGMALLLEQNGLEATTGLGEKFIGLMGVAETYGQKRVVEKKVFDYLVSRPFEKNPALLHQDGVPIPLEFNKKKYVLEGALAAVLRKLVRHLLAIEFNYVADKTRALYSMFAAFDKTYAASARNAGLLTFSDIACLIRGNTPTALPYTDLQTLEERIDSRTDHYMLDEFQDTSNRQWEILENLADEAIHNYAGERDRSFFFVGDIKQSIYQWRQGNPKLFGMICRDHGFTEDGANGNLLSTLERSFRSSVPVIETVNRVYQTSSFPPADTKRLLPEAIEAMQFKPHSSAPSAAAQPGCTMMFELADHTKEFATVIKGNAIANLLKEIDPFSKNRKKPLTVGILVRKNDRGTELAYHLLRHGFPVTVDGKLDPAESLAFTVYKQMLRLAAHPGDKMAQEFLNMLVYGGQKYDLPSSEEIRNMIAQQGFLGFTRFFFRTFSDMDIFDHNRVKAVEEAALRADQTLPVTIDEFLAELKLLKAVETSVRNTVQIMTIHKSKGLDFDIVILPETSSKQRSIVRQSVNTNAAVRMDKNGVRAQWISFLPNSAFIPLLPEVQEYAEEADFSACYENCCNLYVAMTRARNALYIFNDPPPQKPTAVQFADFLRYALIGKTDPERLANAKKFAQNCVSKQDLDVSYANGDPEWYKQEEAEKQKILTPSEEAAKKARNFCALAREASRFSHIIRAERPCRIKPSAAHETAQTYFFHEPKAANLGTRLHEILSDFTFHTDALALEDFLLAHEVNAEEREILETFFHSPEIAERLKEPAGKYELWREKRFLTTLGNGIVNGCFDRVLIRYAEDGSPSDAEIMDYKSDRDVTEESLKERHASQLELYRKVLANLTGLSTDQIRCSLLSVRYGFAVTF